MREVLGVIARCGIAAAFAVAAGLAGCASSSPEKGEGPESPPQDVADALLPPMGYAPPHGPRDAGPQRFDLNVKDVPAQAFFMSLVEGTPYNMVVQPAVSGSITLNLKNVTVPEVMDYVRDAFGYDYRVGAGGYTVYAESMQSRIFRLNYLNVKRSGKSRIFVSSGTLTNSGGNQPGAVGGGVALQQPGLGNGVNGQTLPSSDIETDSDSDFWADIGRSLHTLVPDGQGRSLVVNPAAGLVVVRAMTSELRNVRNYLDSMQSNMSRQVTLEAKIIEVQLNEGFQAGINWAALGSGAGGATGFAGQVGGQNVFENGATPNAGATVTLDPATGLPITSIATNAIGGALTLALDYKNFDAVIEMLQTQGDVKVLSNPRVSTVNNQKAVIKVGSDEFFVTGVSSNTVTGAATSSSRNIQFTPFFSGIALDVTPQIDEQDYVTLHVHPSVSQVTDKVKTLQVDNAVETFPLALSTVREADSIVRARSGQIIVIGGLMTSSNRDDRFGVPVLSKLPLVGVLFRQTRVRDAKSELVILLKPQVMDTEPMWTEEVQRSDQRVQDLQSRQRRWWN